MSGAEGKLNFGGSDESASRNFEPSYHKGPIDSSAPKKATSPNSNSLSGSKAKGKDKKYLLVDSSNREVGPFSSNEIFKMFPLGRQLPLQVKVESIESGNSMSLEKFLATRDVAGSRRDKTKVAAAIVVPPAVAIAVVLIAILIPVGFIYLRGF